MSKKPELSLSADHHVHSTFSDGSGSLEDNLEAARRAGLRHLGFVDHVRSDSDWVPAYAARVAELAAGSDLTLTCGVEAKILNREGLLDLPKDMNGVDRVIAADHQLPGHTGPLHPGEVRAALEGGRATPSWVVEGLVQATIAAMTLRRGLLLAHLFSLLPKVGLAEDDVSDLQIVRLAEAASTSGALVEVSERWRCPSLRTLQVFRDADVPIVASSDAHSPSAIGRYDYVAFVFAALDTATLQGSVA
ncbi:MAG: PHP domain-containing protein [Gemmatimonadota bacterium]|nr:PHP domain-containing protein [Gemmatimonadota bacterium]